MKLCCIRSSVQAMLPVLAIFAIGGLLFMPWWKDGKVCAPLDIVTNLYEPWAENVLLGAKLSEYHTGYRAFSRTLIEKLPLEKNSDDFVFDNQMLAQILWTGTFIAEVSCPTKYFKEASSINFRRSCKYGFGCLWTALLFRLGKMGMVKPRLFEP